MKPAETNSWQAIHGEIMRRISAREWKPGDSLPHEVDLAREFGCARATVNRAMREIAATGLIERRRKAGTRVAVNPVRMARLEIPIIRHQVEASGMTWSHRLLERRHARPPRNLAATLRLQPESRMLRLRSLHLADDKPFLYEERWINSDLITEALAIDFQAINANEWLVQNVPFSLGDVMLSAANATQREAELLATEPGAALFLVERVTWSGEVPITRVRMAYAPGYRMQTTI